MLTLASRLPAVSIALAPGRDNTLIQQTNPNVQLSNGQGDLFSGRTNQDGQGSARISIRRSLIYFDIAAAIPSWATITDVTLTMRDVTGLNGDRLTTLHRVQQDWGEGTSFQSGGMESAASDDDATWLYTFFDADDPMASPAWTTPGGDFDAAVSGSAIVADDFGGGHSFTWTGAGMIGDVQDWLDNPGGNFGWLIRGDESMGQTAKRLNGRTLNNPSDVAPVLSVSYVPEPATIGLALLAAAGLLIVRPKQRTAPR